MAENILILVPSSYDAVPTDRNLLVNALRETSFIADTIEVNGEQHYRPGDEFMMQITFLGCSPVVSMGEPGKTGEEFCHIAIEGPLERPQFLAGDNVKIPRCPDCGHRFDDWQTVVNNWSTAPDSESICPACGVNHSASQLRWRKCAGFGRFFIKIWGVFESEAVPSPNFIAALQRVSGTEWQHFYIRNFG